MSYNSIADMAQDNDLRWRMVACAATEEIANPWGWVDMSIWELVSQPGWGDAYASAQAANKPKPGRDESVITDPMILAAVQAVYATQNATLDPEEGI